jgi:hypothetical protein
MMRAKMREMREFGEQEIEEEEEEEGAGLKKRL